MVKILIVALVFLGVGLLPALPFSDDSELFTSAVAEGVGRTLLVAVLACVGLLYTRNKTLGFSIAAAVFSGLVMMGQAYLKSHDNVAWSTAPSEHGQQEVGPAPYGAETVSNVAETKEMPAPASSADVAAVGPAANLQPIPTIGQFTAKIGIAVDDFAAIYAKDRMTGAVTFSRNCQRAALQTNDILETDYCVAFDMAAMATDLSVSQSLGTPQSEYFRMRAQNLDADYARFQQANPNRTQLIWTEVSALLEHQSGNS